MTSGSAAAAEAAGLGHATLKRFERGVHMLIENNMAALRRALEDAGVEFIDRGKTKGPGVRLRE
jgi:predicted RNase H-like nuclease (RuvC/YqgF family)